MNLVSKWNTRAPSDQAAMPDQVQAYLRKYTSAWYACESALPAFKLAYQADEQARHEKDLEKQVSGLIYALKRIPDNPEDRQAWQDRLRPGLVNFIQQALNLEQRHMDFAESSGLFEASQEFARMARRFDPKISVEDISQAARNVTTANFMQLLLNLPVAVTPSVFAYSMLYPYTDNYLDDPGVPRATKLAFNQRFRNRLLGESAPPANDHEATIYRLVAMIEAQWDRARYPQVYASLLAIHTAQAHSLALVAPGISPYELDVLGISLEKGGASVMADGYLVAGQLDPAQAEIMFGYGSFTQLMDDMEDVQQDQREGRMTIFSQTGRYWPLDGVVNRVFHYGRAVFADLSAFPSQSATILRELVERSVDPLLIHSIGQAAAFYSKDYLREVERHLPFRFAAIEKQRQKINRQKIDWNGLIAKFL